MIVGGNVLSHTVLATWCGCRLEIAAIRACFSGIFAMAANGSLSINVIFRRSTTYVVGSVIALMMLVACAMMVRHHRRNIRYGCYPAF